MRDFKLSVGEGDDVRCVARPFLVNVQTVPQMIPRQTREPATAVVPVVQDRKQRVRDRVAPLAVRAREGSRRECSAALRLR